MENLIGYVAAFLTTVSFLPAVLRVVMTKQTRDISRNMYIMFFLGVVLWFVYGILRSDLPIILANVVTLFFVTIILYYKLTEGNQTGSLEVLFQ
uniref:Sugar transporter SemiSWEET n=1 Tax=Leptospira biflexa serovar Patoc (strain Patoc 1 / ATCC 23582 / Paris) TaxID=456481 RepID=UPI000B8BB343|nr:Chain A, Sugar transporter SemiSWEET [Leptospira biflexa serovar Patoc strain 'Patoc 1 (Paris)']5UHQ_B Chain B, Sugar transporter SemiSWEET [Leptospira biflexa serovar Patoc strain 'Patoc 1 (Paris)']5UHQ_C Chain C, Sugar transporter SemiSWEET [Leptospira biflexa serovar Patoc strain 'Patoc 1 (Paris)']5UHQ_D Chain D, Sugar transporter SemiSWEET [Leptospira biflexa serovar Patoc strain 'Patoc 1 (Paris)']